MVVVGGVQRKTKATAQKLRSETGSRFKAAIGSHFKSFLLAAGEIRKNGEKKKRKKKKEKKEEKNLRDLPCVCGARILSISFSVPITDII